MTDDPFFDAAEAAIETDAAKTSGDVRVLAQRALKEKQDVEVVEADLTARKSSLNKLLMVELPGAMEAAGTDFWRDPETGTTIELETKIDSKMPKEQDKRNVLFAQLRPLGVDDILGQEFSVVLSPDHPSLPNIRALFIPDEATGVDPETMQRIAELRDLIGLTGVPADQKMGVHPSRFKAWLKELITRNPTVDDAADDVLDETEPAKRSAVDIIRGAGIWFGRQAAIKPPKKGKK